MLFIGRPDNSISPLHCKRKTMKRLFTVGTIIVLLHAFQKEVKSQSNNLKNKKMEPKTEKSAIEKLISSYQEALNASDTGKVIALYTKDGVLMANAAPTAEGVEQVKGTYQYVFNNFSY